HPASRSSARHSRAWRRSCPRRERTAARGGPARRPPVARAPEIWLRRARRPTLVLLFFAPWSGQRSRLRNHGPLAAIRWWRWLEEAHGRSLPRVTETVLAGRLTWLTASVARAVEETPRVRTLDLD